MKNLLSVGATSLAARKDLSCGDCTCVADSVLKNTADCCFKNSLLTANLSVSLATSVNLCMSTSDDSSLVVVDRWCCSLITAVENCMLLLQVGAMNSATLYFVVPRIEQRDSWSSIMSWPLSTTGDEACVVVAGSGACLVSFLTVVCACNDEIIISDEGTTSSLLASPVLAKVDTCVPVATRDSLSGVDSLLVLFLLLFDSLVEEPNTVADWRTALAFSWLREPILTCVVGSSNIG